MWLAETNGPPPDHFVPTLAKALDEARALVLTGATIPVEADLWCKTNAELSMLRARVAAWGPVVRLAYSRWLNDFPDAGCDLVRAIPREHLPPDTESTRLDGES